MHEIIEVLEQFPEKTYQKIFFRLPYHLIRQSSLHLCTGCK